MYKPLFRSPFDSISLTKTHASTKEATGVVLRTHALSQKDIAIQRKRKVLEAKIASLQEEFESVQDELNKSYIEEDLKKEIIEKNRKQMIENRLTKNAGNGKSK